MGVIWKAVQRITARPRFRRSPNFYVLTGIRWFEIHAAVWQGVAAVFADQCRSVKTVCQNHGRKSVQVSDLDGHIRSVSQGQAVSPRLSILGGTR